MHLHESKLEIEYIKVPAEEYAKDHADEFDVVTCLEMLEHVPDPSQVIAACATLVKPGGDVYFSTINRNTKAYAFAIIGAEYVLQLLPKGTHEYAKFIKPSELAQWSRDANLSWQEITGMTYNPFTKKYRLNQNDVSVNYLVHVKKSVN